MTLEWWHYPLLSIAGAAAGFIDAIAGGGGLIALPALVWAGLPPQIALGTNKLQSSCGTLLAVTRYMRAGLIQWRGLRLAVGLTPAFFGEALGGSKMPNLTSMLVFPDEAARAAAWKSFGGDDAWKKLKAIPEYADKEIVSRITNKILAPEPYSEI